MKRWLIAAAAIGMWAALSFAYGFAALTAIAMALGREGSGHHLIAAFAALVLWVAATVWGIVQLMRRLASGTRRPG